MKDKIIIGLSIALAVVLWLYFAQEETIKEVEVTKIVYKTITDTIDNTKPTKIDKIVIKTIDTIKESDTITKIVYKDLKVNKYVYKDSLKNGVIDATIVADNIYDRKVKLTTFNKETETTVTKTVVKSTLYFGVGVTTEFDRSINNASINAYYTHKNRFLLTGGLGYGVKSETPTVNLGVAFKF